MSSWTTNARTPVFGELPPPDTYEVDPAPTFVEVAARQLGTSGSRRRFPAVAGSITVAEDDDGTRVTVSLTASGTDVLTWGADEPATTERIVASFRSARVASAAPAEVLGGELAIREVDGVGLQVSYAGFLPTDEIGVVLRGTTKVPRAEWDRICDEIAPSDDLQVGPMVEVDLLVQASARS